MTQILQLLADGKARSVEELAEVLDTTAEDIKRRMEFLERAGYLRRIRGCGHGCQGCSSHCGMELDGGFPVFWEIVPHEKEGRLP